MRRHQTTSSPAALSSVLSTGPRTPPRRGCGPCARRRRQRSLHLRLTCLHALVTWDSKPPSRLSLLWGPAAGGGAGPAPGGRASCGAPPTTAPTSTRARYALRLPVPRGGECTRRGGGGVWGRTAAIVPIANAFLQRWSQSFAVARRPSDLRWMVCTLVLQLCSLRGSGAGGFSAAAPAAARAEAAVVAACTAALLLFTRYCPQRYCRVRTALVCYIRLVRAALTVWVLAPRVRHPQSWLASCTAGALLPFATALCAHAPAPSPLHCTRARADHWQHAASGQRWPPRRACRVARGADAESVRLPAAMACPPGCPACGDATVDAGMHPQVPCRAGAPRRSRPVCEHSFGGGARPARQPRLFAAALCGARGSTVLACLRVVGCGLWFVVTHSPSPPGARSQGATSLPEPPSGPSTPLGACIALQWMQLLVLGFGLPTVLLQRSEARSRRLLLGSVLHCDDPGLRREARQEVAHGWALPERPPPHERAAAVTLASGSSWHRALSASCSSRRQTLSARAAAVTPYLAAAVLAWQGGSVAWALCVVAADGWVAAFL